MATANDGIKSRKTPIRTENPAGMSSDEGGNSGISELEQMLKQVTVTRFNVQHPTTMEDLPDELLINIFIRLLATQLAQMRSVSKSWNVLLSHPSFVKSHLHHSIHNNNQQILLVLPNYFEPFTEFSCQSKHLEPTNFIKRIPTNFPMSRVIGAVNGLICLFSKYDYSNIHIWNPSLSAISTIPPPHSLPPISMRFGFDPKTDDYKIVKISGIYSGNFDVKKWLQVEVYSMRKGCWEFITQPFPSHIVSIYIADKVCVDGHHGHLHWQGISGSWTERTIVAFHLGSETFHEMPYPDSMLHSNHIFHQLGVLDGKLCEMTQFKKGRWEVWVMEEYGVPESWAIRHVLNQFEGEWSSQYGFTSRNEFLVTDKEGRLVLCDPIANKTKSTRTKEYAMKIVEYVDSLVWI